MASRWTRFAAALLLALGYGCDDGEGGGGAGGAGGAGDAAVELDGGGGDGGAVDAEVFADNPIEGDIGAPSDRCRQVCDDFAACTDEPCRFADGAALYDACLEACGLSPSFTSVLAGIDNCADRVAFVAQQSPTVADACEIIPPPPAEEPLCDDYGVRAAECLGEICAPADALGPGAQYSFINFCNTQVGLGNIQPAQLGAIGQAPCDSPLIAPVVDFIVNPGADPASGSFAELCADGPQNPAETCEAACETVRGCIPEGTPENMGGALRDEGLCRLVCGVGIAEIPRESWPCLVDAECVELGGCISDPPPIEPAFDCGGFSARAAVCIVESCAPAEGYRDDLVPFIDELCAAAVDEGEAEPDALAAVGPETPCDHEALVGAVAFFTEVLPDEDDSGLLAPLCAGMPPANAPALCGSACATLAPCIPAGAGEDDGGALADERICRLFCGLSPEIPSDRWQCVDAAADCMAVFACFPDEGGAEDGAP